MKVDIPIDENFFTDLLGSKLLKDNEEVSTNEALKSQILLRFISQLVGKFSSNDLRIRASSSNMERNKILGVLHVENLHPSFASSIISFSHSNRKVLRSSTLALIAIIKVSRIISQKCHG